MKRIVSLIVVLASMSGLHAQVDSTFVGKFENEEYKIFLQLNLEEKNIIVPGQEVFGEMDGYVGSTQTTHVWAIVSSTVEGNTATLDLVNNYGSEDFQATQEHPQREPPSEHRRIHNYCQSRGLASHGQSVHE